MADDFDNTDEIENLSDDELRTLVRSELRWHDVTEAIGEAELWIPPEGPTPEGYDSGESARDVDDR
jgi:hypothetical protein